MKVFSTKHWQSLRSVLLFIFVLCIMLSHLNSPVKAQDTNLDVPYVPTPVYVVKQMLKMADVNPSDYLIDLGSGDGRIVIAAARMGALAHGVELDPERIEQAEDNAENAGVADKVIFLEEDLFETDFTRASVITMYLLPGLNVSLRPLLLERLEPGTRIVSHSFDMDDWEPDDSRIVLPDSVGGGYHPIYMWIIPAQVQGHWEWTAMGDEYQADIKQKFQRIFMESRSGIWKMQSKNLYLRGDRIRFTVERGARTFYYSGRVEGDTIYGTVQLHRGNTKVLESWEARRTSE
ncbi:MAG: methyltransferase domain-containing protein [Candidatus Marinimicrobia bacterium]|nr:methyltransferase domain-containing protein [Candidatus Neomarinimicrobiota bacterium]